MRVSSTPERFDIIHLSPHPPSPSSLLNASHLYRSWKGSASSPSCWNAVCLAAWQDSQLTSINIRSGAPLTHTMHAPSKENNGPAVCFSLGGPPVPPKRHARGDLIRTGSKPLWPIYYTPNISQIHQRLVEYEAGGPCFPSHCWRGAQIPLLFALRLPANLLAANLLQSPSPHIPHRCEVGQFPKGIESLDE